MSDEESFYEIDAIGRDGEIVGIHDDESFFICCTCGYCCVVGYDGKCETCWKERCYNCATGSPKQDCQNVTHKVIRFQSTVQSVLIKDLTRFKMYKTLDLKLKNVLQIYYSEEQEHGVHYANITNQVGGIKFIDCDAAIELYIKRSDEWSTITLVEPVTDF